MGRPATRPAPKSGIALRYQRQLREAAAALAAQAGQFREIRAVQAGAVEPASTPLSGAGDGAAESVIGIPISEQDQRVEVAPEARVKPRKAARNMHAAMSAEPEAEPSNVPAKISVPPLQPGTWPIADLREGQCRFACTPHGARPEDHRFCGEPVAWKGGKPTSWCREHLPVISGAPGRSPGGASEADLEREAR